jgi:ubiquinone/menaquinone biosynthesis C-methylase UbiE/ADP-ribose pyrophosphatase YjhB (NUDIX family)
MTDAPDTGPAGDAAQPATQLVSAVLFERDGHVLVVHRRAGRPPFAEQWLVPMTPVGDEETAEEALHRYGPDQFGVSLSVDEFADTIYAEDPQDAARYVVNLFRAPAGARPAHFNTDGDYDEARWCVAGEIERLWMPPSLRDALVRIIVEGVPPPVVDWATQAGREGIPLADREAEAGPPPDNCAVWDQMAPVYQDEFYGDRYGERLMWSRRSSEHDLRVLDDVRGKHALVLGCGGGQDCVALEKLGAIVVGVDQSPKQIEYARKYATRHKATNASFVEGLVEDLTAFDDERFDLAVSIYTLDFVEDVGTALGEATRVLKPGGALVIAVKHPFDLTVDGGPPYRVVRSYWSDYADQPWRWKDGTSWTLRVFPRTISRWFEILADAGLVVERLVEPREDALAAGPDDTTDNAWLALLPYTLVLKARKR